MDATNSIEKQGNNPSALLQIAVEKGADVEKLEKLMELQERWDANEARKAFFTAMAAFQGDAPAIDRGKSVKDRNGRIMYSYAPLEAVLDAIRPAERAHGFMHSWNQEDLDGGGVRILCKISHTSGHTETSSVTIPPTTGMNTNAAQDRGIIVTYGQRRSLLNAYGLATGGEDRDGADPEPSTVTPQQAAHLKAAIKSSKTEEAHLLKWAGCLILADFPAGKYNEAMDVMRLRENQKGGAQ